MPKTTSNTDRSLPSRAWGWIKDVRHRPLRLVAMYVALVILSQFVQWIGGRWYVPTMEMLGAQQVEVPAMSRSGPVGDRTMSIAYLEWTPDESSSDVPVVLLHGSPGQAIDLSRLGTELSQQDRRVFAFDLPGFGNSTPAVPSYSNLAHARGIWAALDALEIKRAHLVGWSNSGGIVLYMTDLAPDRVASLTLMAATGAQETEGTGNYYFEHFKYAAGFIGVVALPEVLPHFGLLADTGMRHAFIRSFWDTDQRPLRGIMEQLDTPTLILHGRRDFLVRDRAAELHHELIPTSRLVMIDADHVFPYWQADLAVAPLAEHFDRHEQLGVTPLTDYLNLAPRPERTGWRAPLERVLARYLALGWWWQALILVPLTWWRRDLSFALVGWVVATGWLDFGVATVGLLVGSLIGRRRTLTLGRAVGLVFSTVLALAFTRLFGSRLVELGADHLGLVGFVGAILIVAATLYALRRVWTLRGRQQLAATYTRIIRYEFWPAWFFYIPLGPWLLWLAIRHRGPLLFTAVNPGIGQGGGVIGESKDQILSAFRDGREHLLDHAVIEPGPTDQRLAEFERALDQRPELGGYPIILKPDAAQRGFGLRLVRNHEEARAALEVQQDMLIAQRYHPGPHEVGVLWIRHAAGPQNGREGFIFAVTRKEFPDLVGDGSHTIEQLIWAHPRFRCQAKIFLERFSDRLNDVPDHGQTIRLAHSGNHCQGVLFRDGDDLVTPDLEREIDRLCSSFRGLDGGPLDFGRFDIRYESDESLRKGERFGVVELNGATAEATNLYDPEPIVIWAYGVLFRQWSHLYRLGALRRAQGVKPMRAHRLIGLVYGYYRDRRGSELAD